LRHGRAVFRGFQDTPWRGRRQAGPACTGDVVASSGPLATHA